MSEDLTTASPQLDPGAILIAEFEYISQTAFQANEDRARVSSYYFVTAAAAVAAIFGVDIEAATPPIVYFGFSVVFAILGIVGLLTVLQLARLRLAWTESARAMNSIKEYYEAHCPKAQLEDAFAWTTSTIPPAGKPSSIAFLLSLSIILIDSPVMGTAVTYISLALGARPNHPLWLSATIFTGLV